MDRIFLDANVLFSAVYRPDARLRVLWTLRNVSLCSSHYALEEARINLDDERQRATLNELARALSLFEASSRRLPEGISLPQKDAPILIAAIEIRATHLLTGDIRHFGRYMGKKVGGVKILTPGEYLKERGERTRS